MAPDMQRAEETAKRLRLLLDAAAVERGEEPQFPEISAYLSARGVHISRGKWNYLVHGHRQVVDPELFAALSEFFGVEPGFLMGENGQTLPEKVQAQMDLVRSMRAAKVKSFAARTLGDVSPEALRAISRFLDEEVTGTHVTDD